MFADIVLPLKGDGFTYSTAGANVEVGQSVDVPLGRGGKQYSGIVWRLHNDVPNYATKEILAVGEQVLNQEQMQLWRWVADYYMCTLGEVMRFALPAQLKTGKEVRQRKKPLNYIADFNRPTLSQAQQSALDDIIHPVIRSANATSPNTTLLCGITGSGKTEIYKHLIARELHTNRSVLYLVPEIAMSSQLVARMETVFGDRVVVHHSSLTTSARTNIYKRLQQSAGGELIMGVRSAIFLPLNNLGLVIVDDEHDDAYKQSDEQPRYNARDCAVAMAHRLGIPCLLASATPSIESYANALSGKYAMTSLTERYGDAQLPEIEISDTMRSLRRGERKSHFNKELKDAIAETLARGEQTMLLQNRHGGLSERGYGTEHLAEEVAQLYPEARTARLDGEIMTSPRKYKELLKSFADGEIDILIGTQIIAKGFDFPRVTLVGVLNADNLLLSPDFRNTERTFQLLTQIAGRAGRSTARGRVIIQTSQPDNPLFSWLAAGDYRSMALAQIAERQPYNYPPYGRLIEITLRHASPEILRPAADKLYNSLQQIFAGTSDTTHNSAAARLLGATTSTTSGTPVATRDSAATTLCEKSSVIITAPHPPQRETVKGHLHCLTLLLRLPLSASPAATKTQLAATLSPLRNIEIAICVDPA